MRVLVDRLLSEENYHILIDGLESKDLELKFKCVNGILEAIKLENNRGFLANQELIEKLTRGLVDVMEFSRVESKYLQALYLLVSTNGIYYCLKL